MGSLGSRVALSLKLVVAVGSAFKLAAGGGPHISGYVFELSASGVALRLCGPILVVRARRARERRGRLLLGVHLLQLLSFTR